MKRQQQYQTTDLSSSYAIVGYDADGLPCYDISEGPEDWAAPNIPDYACRIQHLDALRLMPEQSQLIIYLDVNPISLEDLAAIARVLKPNGKVIIIRKPIGGKK